MAGGMCGGVCVHGRWCVWRWGMRRQDKGPLQRTVRILLECILVVKNISQVVRNKLLAEVTIIL